MLELDHKLSVYKVLIINNPSGDGDIRGSITLLLVIETFIDINHYMKRVLRRYDRKYPENALYLPR